VVFCGLIGVLLALGGCAQAPLSLLASAVFALMVGLGLGGCGGDDEVDADHDGYPASKDCDDHNYGVNPGAGDLCGIDMNCNGKIDIICNSFPDPDDPRFHADAGVDPDPKPVDADHDGSFEPEDCDDHDPTVHPGAADECFVDKNCDGSLSLACNPAPDFDAGTDDDAGDDDAG
jgi:hypothetical protein